MGLRLVVLETQDEFNRCCYGIAEVCLDSGIGKSLRLKLRLLFAGLLLVSHRAWLVWRRNRELSGESAFRSHRLRPLGSNRTARNGNDQSTDKPLIAEFNLRMSTELVTDDSFDQA